MTDYTHREHWDMDGTNRNRNGWPSMAVDATVQSGPYFRVRQHTNVDGSQTPTDDVEVGYDVKITSVTRRNAINAETVKLVRVWLPLPGDGARVSK